MTQPAEAEQSGGGAFSRRVAFLPVWLWVIILAGAAFLIWRWRKNKASTGSSALNSSISSAPNVGQPDAASLMPYTQDINLHIIRGDQSSSLPADGGGGTGNAGGQSYSYPGNITGTVPAPTNTGGGTTTSPGPSSNQSQNTAPNNTPTPAPRQTGVSYSVQPGDTLYSIAAKYPQDYITAQSIFAANSSTIDAVARQHGFSSSDSGHWIFPGENLLIPL